MKMSLRIDGHFQYTRHKTDSPALAPTKPALPVQPSDKCMAVFHKLRGSEFRELKEESGDL